MDIIKIYTNNKKLMDINAAKQTILSIAKKFHLNHLDYLLENTNSQTDENCLEIPCEIQIEPYLDSEITVDFYDSKNELTELYGREYRYFSKTCNLQDLDLFISKLKKERDQLLELAQLYKVFEFFKFKFEFAKSQNTSAAEELYEDLNELGSNIQNLFPDENVIIINHPEKFNSNNRKYKLKDLNRQKLKSFEENKNRVRANISKQIMMINNRLDDLIKIKNPNTLENNEINSLKPKLIKLNLELKKNESEVFKKIRVLPEEELEVEKIKTVIIENKKCEKIISQNYNTLYNEENIIGLQRYSEDPKYFVEEYYIKMGFFFPSMKAYKDNENEKIMVNNEIEKECDNFRSKYSKEFGFSDLMEDTYSVDYKKDKNHIMELYEKLRGLAKNERFPDSKTIMKFCEENSLSVKDIIKF